MIDSPQHAKARKGLRILIVEDTDLSTKILLLAFGSNHFVYTASDTKKGWEVFLEKNPEMVFMDIGLPDGNGHDLARMIKEKNPATYIVMATASHQKHDKIEAVQNHADGFITKPFNKNSINDYIEQYMAIQRGSH